MVCKNCGAKFRESEAKCPYCGALNVKGAKRLFKRKLDRMTDEVEEMAIRPKKVLVQDSVKIILLFLAGMIFVTVVIVLLATSKVRVEKRLEAKEERENMATIQWENEAFLQLDQWYSNQEFDRILEFQDQLYDEQSDYDIYRWRHYTFMRIYEYYADCVTYMEDDQKIEAGTVIYGAMNLLYEYSEEEINKNYYSERGDHGLTQEEVGYVAEYRQYAADLLKSKFNMTEMGIEELHQRCIIDGFITACYDYADEMRDRNK